MTEIVQYSVNIAMEATMICVLIVMLITCLWQKRLFSTTIPLCFMTGFTIICQVIQIIAWCFLIYDIPTKYGEAPMRVVYIMDYIFSYAISVAFYHYLEALVKDGYERDGVCYIGSHRTHKIMIVWGVISAALYGLALFIPSIYHVELGNAVYSMSAYIGLQIFTKFACVCSIVLLIRHRKVISRIEIIISVGVILIVSVFVVLDEILYICIGYVLIGLFEFVLYVGINLHKGLILERQEKDMAELKTQIMLSQMQPHFIYNVLTTISGLCEMRDAYEARDVVNRFAEYFRANLNAMGREKMIPFEKELEHVETYLWLEKIRFEDNLDINYEIGPRDFELPSLSIQPMVENAVKHGIMQREDGGMLTIRTSENDTDYVVEIEDNGVGFDMDEIASDGRVHIGIENVSKRLDLICGASCNIYSKKGEGTLVCIRIPKGGKN